MRRAKPAIVVPHIFFLRNKTYLAFAPSIRASEDWLKIEDWWGACEIHLRGLFYLKEIEITGWSVDNSVLMCGFLLQYLKTLRKQWGGKKLFDFWLGLSWKLSSNAWTVTLYVFPFPTRTTRSSREPTSLAGWMELMFTLHCIQIQMELMFTLA